MPAFTAIPGIAVGHAHDLEALTGCTVVLCPEGTVGGVDVRGGAAGTRQIDALGPLHLVPSVNAVLLTGGSAFGLDAAGGVVRWLEEHGTGFDVRVARVPIVPTAVLFDLALGDARVRPDAAMGYAACRAAGTAPPAEGSVGAGAGATVGKALGLPNAMRGGLGCAAVDLDGVLVGALVAVNAFGDVVDPAGGAVVAGARRPGTFEFPGAQAVLRERLQQTPGAATWGSGEHAASEGRQPEAEGGHTVIGVVVTNARLGKVQVTRVAQMAHDGLARAVRPAHTLVDGDAFFALATGSGPECDLSTLGAFAADVVTEAILRAVRHAEAAAGIPAWRDRPDLDPQVRLRGLE